MKKETQKIDATAFQQCKSEPLFAFIRDQKTNKVQIVVGNYKVSRKEFDNFKDAEAYVWSKPYELLINTACLIMKLNNEQKKEQNEN